MTEISRRGFLAAAGGSVAGAWLAADASKILEAGKHAADAIRLARNGAVPRLQYLSAAQAADLDAATSQIIPTDDTPGAHEAGVVYFIDKSLATYAADQRDAVGNGIAELHARAAKAGAVQAGAMRAGAKTPKDATFAALADSQQQALIASLERDKHPFFFLLRGATITGLLANPEYGGNVDKAGWKLIGFDDRFSWAPPFGWYDAHE